MKRVIPIAVAGAPPATAAAGETASGLQPQALPLALYIHFPWCVQKCPYCDFNSHAAGAGIPEDAYLVAVIADLEAALPGIWGRRVSSIFIGGGTPSLLSAAGLERLLTAVRMRVPLLPEAEVTLEANPGTVEAGRFAAYRDAGVTRLSIGVQSFNPRHLRALGRIHGADEARRAAELAARHFATFNLDLMYGLPGQTFDEALADVDAALACGPTHLSCYQLTIEPNTPFAAAPPPLPEGDLAADMQDALEARLAAAGFGHYETSAFARAGHRCRHNLNYWLFGDYLGIGPGAHSKLSFHDRILRQMRWKSPRQYLAEAPAGRAVQEEQQVSAAELPFEFMMNALRLIEGFPQALFRERTGLPWPAVAAEVEAARRDGLLLVEGGVIRPSERGRRFLNPLLQRFLAAD